MSSRPTSPRRSRPPSRASRDSTPRRRPRARASRRSRPRSPTAPTSPAPSRRSSSRSAASRRSCPPTVDPQVVTFSFGDFPVIQLAVTSDLDSAELADRLETVTVPDLESIPGVSAANVFGVAGQRITITPDLAALAQDGLSTQSIRDALQVERHAARRRHHRRGRPDPHRAGRRADRLDRRSSRRCPLLGGAPDVTIGDVAEVAIVENPITGISRVNGEPSLTIAITKTPAGNTVDVSKAVNEQLDELAAAVGGNTQFTVVFDQAPFIQQSINSLATEGLLGLFFAVIVIFLFLFSVRSTSSRRSRSRSRCSSPSSGCSRAATRSTCSPSVRSRSRSDASSTTRSSSSRTSSDTSASARTSCRRSSTERRRSRSRSPRRRSPRSRCSCRSRSSATSPASCSGRSRSPSRSRCSPRSSWRSRSCRCSPSGSSRPSRTTSTTRWSPIRSTRPTSSTTRRRCRRATCRSSSGRCGTRRSRSPPRRSCSSAPSRSSRSCPTNFVGNSGQNTLSVTQTLPPGTSLEAKDDAAQAARGRPRGRRRRRDGAGLDRIERRQRARGHLRRRRLDDLLDHDRPGCGSGPGARRRAGRDRRTRRRRGRRGLGLERRRWRLRSSDIEIEITAPDEQTLESATDDILTAMEDLDAHPAGREQPVGEAAVHRDRGRPRQGGGRRAHRGSRSAGSWPRPCCRRPAGSVELDGTTLSIYIDNPNKPLSVEELEDFQIPTFAGLVPLTELATVETVDGPASISTERGVRTATVSVTPNTADIGTASVTVQAELDSLELPDGVTASSAASPPSSPTRSASWGSRCSPRS